jgi:hypothetical protein
MKIIVKQDDYSPEVTIDTNGFVHSWQFEKAFRLALKQEGFIDKFIFEVFNETEETED